MTNQPNQDAMGEPQIRVLPDIFRPIGPSDDVVVSSEKLWEWAEAFAQRRVEEAIQWLEDDIKRIDSRNWDMESLVIEHLVRANEATDDQKRSHNDIVTDRRAALLLYAVLNNYKRLNQTTEDKT